MTGIRRSVWFSVLLAMVCALGAAASVARAAEKPAVLFVGGVHTHYVARPLTQMGFAVDRVAMADLAQKLKTGRYNVVVAGKLDAAGRKALEQFMAKGGGVLMTSPQSAHNKTDQWTATMKWLEGLGARARLSKPVETDESNIVVDKMRQKLAWSDRIEPPVNQGVRRVLTLSNKQSHGMGWPTPYEFSGEWKVVVRGSETMKAVPPRSDRPSYDPWRIEEETDSFSLMAIRDYKQGRLALVGINRKWLFDSPNNCPTCENMLSRGVGGRGSDWLKVFANSFRWLAEPSIQQGMGGAQTPHEVTHPTPKPWKPRQFRNTEGPISLRENRQTNGLIGARTAFSTGSGTVADYVKAAKDADLDFIVFLEKFPEIDQSEWKKLKAQCKQFTGDGFAAIPGLTYQSAQGDDLFVFSDEVALPKEEWLTEDGKRLATTQSYRTRDYFNYINEQLRQKVISGFWRHEDNFVHQADYKLYNGFPIKSFIDGKPVDDAFETYQYWMVNGAALSALSFEIMTSPSMVGERAAEGWQVVSRRGPKTLSKIWHRGAFSFGGDGDQYITNGPKILAWRQHLNHSMHGQWWRPDLWQIEFGLKVSSDTELKTVTLYDGEQVLRRWKPDGKTFEHRLTLTNQQQRGIYPVVEDEDGRRAIGEQYYTRNLMSNQFYCTDRCNFLGSARLRRENGSAKWVENGFTSNGGVTPNKSQLETDYRPAIQLNNSNPTLPIDGKPKGLPGPRLGFSLQHHIPGEYSHLFSKPRGYLIGPDVGAGQADLVLAYDPQASEKTQTPLGYPYEDKQPAKGNAWSSWHNLVPTKVLTGWARIYATVPMLGDQAFRVGWHQTHLELKKQVTLESNENQPAGIPAMGSGGSWKIYKNGELVAQPQTDANKRKRESGEFGKGVYAVQQTPNGDAMVIGGEDLSYQIMSGKRNRMRLFHDPGRTELPKGATLDCTIEFVGAGAHVTGDQLHAFARNFGIAEPGHVGYDATVSRGQEKDNYLKWRLAAENGAVEATTRKAAHLGAYLTTVISGLNGKWSVQMLDRQKSWPNHRALPIRDGKAYAQLDLTERNSDWFIGHPVIADNENVRLTVSWHSPGQWFVEAHNPTDEPMKAALRSNDGWTRFEFEKEIALEPGSSQTWKVKSAKKETPQMLPTEVAAADNEN